MAFGRAALAGTAVCLLGAAWYVPRCVKRSIAKRRRQRVGELTWSTSAPVDREVIQVALEQFIEHGDSPQFTLLAPPYVGSGSTLEVSVATSTINASTGEQFAYSILVQHSTRQSAAPALHPSRQLHLQALKLGLYV
eukprot:TRINITY_DN5920_c0_g1_i1.p1 TRINITY_DN5920_c0_g1~~TRINITY_DN5920_c0_g1_i1.p1  ORF type:complete len:137 (-),score=12.54 TRINITY_DN5920_c0_g1_i1:690-1100(-)